MHVDDLLYFVKGMTRLKELPGETVFSPSDLSSSNVRRETFEAYEEIQFSRVYRPLSGGPKGCC